MGNNKGRILKAFILLHTSSLFPQSPGVHAKCLVLLDIECQSLSFMYVIVKPNLVNVWWYINNPLFIIFKCNIFSIPNKIKRQPASYERFRSNPMKPYRVLYQNKMTSTQPSCLNEFTNRTHMRILVQPSLNWKNVLMNIVLFVRILAPIVMSSCLDKHQTYIGINQLYFLLFIYLFRI